MKNSRTTIHGASRAITLNDFKNDLECRRGLYSSPAPTLGEIWDEQRLSRESQRLCVVCGTHPATKRRQMPLGNLGICDEC